MLQVDAPKVLTLTLNRTSVVKVKWQTEAVPSPRHKQAPWGTELIHKTLAQ